MLGTATLGTEHVDQKISFFDLARFLAARDPGSLSPEWEAEYLAFATDYPQQRPLPIPEWSGRQSPTQADSPAMP